MNGWWKRWGVWIGPTTFLLGLAVLTRIEACGTSKLAEGKEIQATQARIEALEKRVDGEDRWIEEHKLVASSRIAQLDGVDKMLTLVRTQNDERAARYDADISEMKKDIREIRDRLRLRDSGRGGAP